MIVVLGQWADALRREANSEHVTQNFPVRDADVKRIIDTLTIEHLSQLRRRSREFSRTIHHFERIQYNASERLFDVGCEGRHAIPHQGNKRGKMLDLRRVYTFGLVSRIVRTSSACSA